MFGADTPLVVDALQLAGLAAVATGAAVWIFLRRTASRQGQTNEHPSKGSLEDRVRNLERIATDPAEDLAAEIESLRHEKGVN